MFLVFKGVIWFVLATAPGVLPAVSIFSHMSLFRSSPRNIIGIHYFWPELYCYFLLNATIKLNFNLWPITDPLDVVRFCLLRRCGKTLMPFYNIDVYPSHNNCNGNLWPTVVPWPDRIRIFVHRCVRRSSFPSLLPHSYQSMSPIISKTW